MAVLDLALVPPLIVRFFRRGGKAARAKPDTIRITVTDMALIVEDLKSAASVRRKWAALRKIAVIRTDRGPFPDDLFYHIAFDGGDVTVPSQAHNMEAFLSYIAALPGFNPAAHAAAVHSTTNNRFTVCFRVS